tara:strand:+ start:3375 stop:3548 length:174 start_codon:yes stop_codon:yes gene_type:complete
MKGTNKQMIVIVIHIVKIVVPCLIDMLDSKIVQGEVKKNSANFPKEGVIVFAVSYGW